MNEDRWIIAELKRRLIKKVEDDLNKVKDLKSNHDYSYAAYEEEANTVMEVLLTLAKIESEAVVGEEAMMGA